MKIQASSLTMAISYSMVSSPRKWYQLSTTFLVLTTLFYPNTVSCSQSLDIPSYHDHCASIIPEPESTSTDPEVTTTPFLPNQDGYYLGGDEILNKTYSSGYYYSSNDRRVLLFRTHNVYSTNADDVYKVEASLLLQPSRISHGFSDSSLVVSSWSQTGALSFDIKGFWSKSSGKLCMVGSSTSTDHSGEGKVQDFSVLLKLNNVKSSSTITSLVGGTLESLSSADDSSYFKPISLLMFPLLNYKYTKVSKEADYECSDGVYAAKNSLSLPMSFSFCSLFSHRTNSYKLEYAHTCNSSKRCNPFSKSVGYLPQVMSLTSIQCSDDKRSLRFLVEFPNSSYGNYYQPFNPNTSLVAEGSWNVMKRQLCVVACRILTPINSLDGSQVEDCSLSLSLRFPAVWSIGNTSSTSGDIWSKKAVEVSGYFDKIKFRSYDRDRVEIPELKYEYTQVDRARKSCPKKQPSRRQYPDGRNTYEMRFDFSVKHSKGKEFGWGYAYPISVGDKIARRDSYFWPLSSPGQEKSKNATKLQPLNISYQMSFTSYNTSTKEYEQAEISAEGIYNGETGVLCMVGCKYLDSNNQISASGSMDCEILVTVQLSPINSKDHIEGQIQSTRIKSSPLYFESFSFSAVPYYSHSRSIWRMDLEIIMALISNTLVCVFVGYQILYVKKHPGVFPFISLLMLAVLTLGHLIPLVLNFEALFLSKKNNQSFLLQGGGWLEVNEVIVRVVTMVAFLLQIRLLQLVWSARLADGNQKASWIAEKKTFYVSLPLYVAGGLIALFVNWKNYKLGKEMNSTRFYYGDENDSLLVDLRSFAGLVLDGFLFPQIIFNIFYNSKENALSCFFYLGNTLVRLIPHAYDLYRAHHYVDDFNWSYMYANPSADYFSTAWDVIIPLGGLLFAAIVYLQQRNGGRCFLPKRFKELEGYEKVPVADQP